MDRFRKILYLETGASPSRGFESALELARANLARLTVAAAVPLRAGFGRPGFQSGSDHLRHTLERARERELARLVERGEAEGVQVEKRLLWGRPSPAVVGEILRGGHDLLIKVGEDAGDLRARLFGTLDTRLVRTCPSPLWILDPAQRGPFRVVLAAVDVAREDHPTPLARKIVQLASSLAARERAALHVLHAWSMIGESVLRSGMRGLGSPRVERILAKVRRDRRRRLEELVEAEASHRGPRLELEKGEPSRVIRSVARRIEADVVVLGMESRTGLEALLMGHVVDAILGRVHGSLLVVKPDGFRPPVRPGSRGESVEGHPGSRPRRTTERAMRGATT